MMKSPKDAEQIHVTAVFGENIELLPHFIEHYMKMGPVRFHFALHVYERGSFIEQQANNCLSGYGIAPVSTAYGPWSENSNQITIAEIMRCHPDDWWIVADLDEFQVYPRDIRDIIRYANVHGFDYAEGALIDRVAEDGSLAAITRDSLWDQFPMAGRVTYPICGGYIKKIVLCKGRIKLGAGQHSVTAGKLLPASQCFAQVHHFKWNSGLVERLQRRIANFESKVADVVTPSYPEELQRTIEYMMRRNFIIDIKDRIFCFERCDGSQIWYSQWDKVIGFVKKEWADLKRVPVAKAVMSE